MCLAAEHAKEKGVVFEIDTTSEDQTAVAAVISPNTNIFSPTYIAAIKRYNLTLDPTQLH